MFRESSIQAYETSIIGFLLYSLRSMDEKFLQQTLSEKVKLQVSLCWMCINDGSVWVQGKDRSKDPKALNIECTAKDKGGVPRALKAMYSSATTKFPLHV